MGCEPIATPVGRPFTEPPKFTILVAGSPVVESVPWMSNWVAVTLPPVGKTLGSTCT